MPSDLPHLPYEMVIAVLAYMSPADVLNLNLPDDYQKSVLYATQTKRADSRTLTKLFEKYYSNVSCLSHTLYINFNFITQKTINVYMNKQRMPLRVTFDQRYAIKDDVLRAFCKFDASRVIDRVDDSKTLKQLLQMYCPQFANSHHSCCCDNAENKLFVNIGSLLHFIKKMYTFGKCYRSDVDRNVIIVCDELHKIYRNAKCLKHSVCSYS
ncbi:cyun105 [Cyclophragma undans nucleopolyhedrovirus]|uniref:Cyun105 n=1 Tax=Cyclophragma undans nucleopolyhedrovirus TaxID=1906244 RepID=A0A288QD51_9ABAC|nr:cyun105 [Cyclophragma undans nucleopolyhedrovirus]AOT85563.1 cyun105 [Cyclophragma undans nucleopolyhedrovirus]